MTDEKKPDVTPEDIFDWAATFPDEYVNDETLWDEANIIRGEE